MLSQLRAAVVAILVLATINQIFSLLDPVIFRHVIDDYATRYAQYNTGQFVRGVGLLLGLAVGLLVLWSSIGILRESSHILLEGRPPDLQVEDVARAMLKIEGVQEVHDVHLWSLGGGHHALSLHARVPDMHLDECERLLASIKQLASKEFGVEHTTVQLERAGLPAQSGYVMPEPAKN